MSEMQHHVVTSPTQSDVDLCIQNISAAASAIKSYLSNQDRPAEDVLRTASDVLAQAQKTLRLIDEQRQQSKAELENARQKIQDVDDLQTLLDILPVGIVISHDPQNHLMTINRTGSKILNLPPGTNPSKSAAGADQLPYQVLRDGQEVPVDELPMRYSAAHKVALYDVELDLRHNNGNVVNILEYASPLFDEKGAVRGSVGIIVDITARKSIEQRLAMLYQIARALAEANSISEAAGQVLRLICETVGWEYGALWLVDPAASLLKNEGVWYAGDSNFAQFAEAARFSAIKSAEPSLPGYVFQVGESLCIQRLEEFSTPDADEARQAGFCAAYLTPVYSGDKVVAILECLSTRSQIPDQNLTHLMDAVGNQIGIFLERKLLEEALSVRANHQQLLAQAGMALSASYDFQNRLKAIGKVIVPDLADWFAVDMIDANNILTRITATHVDPGKEQLIYQVQPTRAVDPNHEMTPQAEVLLTGQSLVFTDISRALLEETVRDPQLLEIVRQLDPVSSIVVPMIAHDRMLGICTFVHSGSRRHYSLSDLPLVEDIVRRTALALDNALLYAESQKLNVELERGVDERTAQLKMALDMVTNQMVERQHAEEEIRKLNAELELRIIERTSQLESTNRELNKEILNHLEARRKSGVLLRRTRELYRISQMMGTMRTPNEILSLLLSSSYLKNASRASIAILDKTWLEDEPPPEHCFILAEWNRGRRQPKFFNRRFTLEEYGLSLPVPYGQPILIPDIQSVMSLPDPVRKRFADLRTHSLIILPLVAGGEWYGLLSLPFNTRRMPNKDDLLHVRGLVDATSIAIKNIRLLEAESKARQEAETANDLKLKFLAMISHELRTPLTPIKGFATTLLAEDVIWTPDKQKEFLAIISRESDKLSDLIEQLLNLSRIEAGSLRISRKKLFMNNIINSALAQLQALTTQHELVLEIPTDLPPLYGDEQRITQVLTNLVGNAAKFSPVGSQIHISTHQEGEMIQVDVADEGPGIPPKYRERIFEAFRQVEMGTDTFTKGAGLGLAICKGLIEAQKGKIWVQEPSGPGTTMSFTLPVWKDR
ncbi:MAG TPA: ATP-binding protein [Anaerolinea sp.]|nr:ATP-binding protein [Anaerolinea sp.]